jgi:hypothetical protein
MAINCLLRQSDSYKLTFEHLAFKNLVAPCSGDVPIAELLVAAMWLLL